MKAFSNIVITSFISDYLARCSKTYHEPVLKKNPQKTQSPVPETNKNT